MMWTAALEVETHQQILRHQAQQSEEVLGMRDRHRCLCEKTEKKKNFIFEYVMLLYLLSLI